MSFSFLAFNIRHFRGNPGRLAQAAQMIRDLDPDIFGLLEFETELTAPAPSTGVQSNRAAARELMFDKFPDYDFAISDARGSMEILVGYRRDKFEQAIYTQRRSFRANPYLRPGGLLSVSLDGVFYSLLFLHLKSGRDKDDLPQRRDMYKKIWSLNRALTAASPTGAPNLIALGDFNTMGRRGSRGRPRVKASEEIADLAADAQAASMHLATKDISSTWHDWGKNKRSQNPRPLRLDELSGAKRSDLDHAVYSSSLDLVPVGSDGSDLHVRGWPQVFDQDRIDFLWELSDHAAIFGKVRT